MPALRPLDAALHLTGGRDDANRRHRDLLRGRVAPSILSADFSKLGAQVAEVMDAGARVIHVDVMDGHFVPPITIGPLVAASIADQVHDAGGVVDVHLMIERPEHHIEEFAKAGADSITFHSEATPHTNRTLTRSASWAASRGSRSTPAPRSARSRELGDYADIFLCMTVNPGWGGQAFIPTSPDKVERLRETSATARIEVDGGIDPGRPAASPRRARACSSRARRVRGKTIPPRPTPRSRRRPGAE